MSLNSPSTPTRRSRGFYGMLLGQVIVAVAFGSAWGTMPASQRIQLEQHFEGRADISDVAVARDVPLRIAPLYDDPRVVSDSQLLAVLRRTVPRFEYTRLKPNFAEHALRAWSAEAHFSDPGVLSGADLRDFLINHARFVASWGEQIDALLVDTPTGISVRYGFDQCGSVHHDHALACLAEAGVPLSQPIFSPGRSGATLNTAFQESLRDFRLDEQEAEWSALLFALYLPSETRWRNRAGREISFDLLVKRLIRGDKRLGVCSGTHRVYTLAVLLRLDDEHQLLSSSARGDALRFLHDVRELLLVSQFEEIGRAHV